MFSAVIRDLNLKPKNSNEMNIFPYKFAILNDHKGDLSKRWSISFWVYNIDTGKKVRKFDYSVNEFITITLKEIYFVLEVINY